MDYIRITKENLEKEHICCAISNNRDIQVSSKKAWLADRFDEGLRAKDADVVAEKTGLTGPELEKIIDLLAYYGSMEFYEH